MTVSLANDLAAALLDHYIKGPALYQTLQERPLMRFLNAGKKTFPAGYQYVVETIKGTTMFQTAPTTFAVGYSTGDQLTNFQQSENILQVKERWREIHAGFVVSWTELKMDGITITDNNKKSEHPGAEVDRIVEIFEDRMGDYAESWAEAMNHICWMDGTQDAKVFAGVTHFLVDDPTTGTAGSISRATYDYWRNYAHLNIAVSGASQTLCKAIDEAQLILRKRRGKPNKFLCGSGWINALKTELREKGYYTMTGWTGKQDVAVGDIALSGVGVFEYDPWLDDHGKSKYCYEFDSRRIKLRPMAGEENKVLNPERPYDYMAFVKSMTYTGVMTANQMNCHGVFSCA
jgi:hypothetical protein